MNDYQKAVAEKCLSAAHDGSLEFPEIVRCLIEAGFESYAVDFRRRTAVYYLPNGDNLELVFVNDDTPVGADFGERAIRDAILEAQTAAAGYTYNNFCAKVKRAGCAGYIVSFAGRRAVYFGRTAETLTEHFPR
jgi:uncharacterized protein YbcV (DUF1398 family)